MGEKAAGKEKEWAVHGGMKDIDAAFDALRPDLAKSYPFELDAFQKEAVLHLEQVDYENQSCERLYLFILSNYPRNMQNSYMITQIHLLAKAFSNVSKALAEIL